MRAIGALRECRGACPRHATGAPSKRTSDRDFLRSGRRESKQEARAWDTNRRSPSPRHVERRRSNRSRTDSWFDLALTRLQRRYPRTKDQAGNTGEATPRVQPQATQGLFTWVMTSRRSTSSTVSTSSERCFARGSWTGRTCGCTRSCSAPARRSSPPGRACPGAVDPHRDLRQRPIHLQYETVGIPTHGTMAIGNDDSRTTSRATTTPDRSLLRAHRT